MSKTTNIRQRKNGLWEGRYRLNGKQCAVYGQTKAEAKAKLAARMTEVEQGICIERTDLTLEEWGWEWLKTFKGKFVIRQWTTTRVISVCTSCPTSVTSS